jgi:hypothetical protein
MASHRRNQLERWPLIGQPSDAASLAEETVFTDELQEKLNRLLLGIANNPERGAEGALAWLCAARCNYQNNPRRGQLTEDGVQEVLKRLDQAEALLRELAT